jgi:hypothetical protein
MASSTATWLRDNALVGEGSAGAPSSIRSGAASPPWKGVRKSRDSMGTNTQDLGTESLAASPSHIDSSPPSRFGSYPAATREPTVGNSGCGRSFQSNQRHRRVFSGLVGDALSDVEVLAGLP